MLALPREFWCTAEAQITGLACPSCPGVLTVRAEGKVPYLHFQCRIGHTFSLEEVLVAKERQIEDALWASVVGLEKMKQLLLDLETHPQRGWSDGDAYAERRARATTAIETLRALLRRDIPIQVAMSTEIDGPSELP